MPQHGHTGSDMGSVLKWSLALTVVFVALEVIAGIHASSLALLADAGHNVTDALALMLAWFGLYFGRRPPDEIKTYGYHRAGVLAAFINALLLLILGLYVLYESYLRWLAPEPVQEFLMLAVAGFGLIINVAIMLGLNRERKADINIRSAWVHMLGDAIGSIGIIFGAVVIHYTGWHRIDPLLSAFIGLLIVWTAWDVLKEALNILLEGSPRGIELRKVGEAIRKIHGVIEVHDLHIWSLSSSQHALSSHIVIEDLPPSESESILRNINTVLHDRFGIYHTTIQFEHAKCPGCPIPVADTRAEEEDR